MPLTESTGDSSNAPAADILVLEDDSERRARIAACLRDAARASGAWVEKPATGFNAPEFFSETPAAVCLIGHDGGIAAPRLTAEIRAARPEVPCIWISWTEAENAREHADGAGAFDNLRADELTASLLGHCLRYAFASFRQNARMAAEQTRIEHLMRNVRCAFWKIGLSNGRLLEYSPTAEEILGHEIAPHRDRPVWELPGFRGQADWIESLVERVANGENLHVNVEYRRPDGRLLLLQIRAKRAFDHVAEGILVDITEQSDRARRFQIYAEMVRQSPLVNIVLDTEGIVREVNARTERETDCAADELVGQDFRRLVSRDVPEERFHAMWRKLRAGASWKGELLLRRRDGGQSCEIATLFPILDEEGKTTHYAAELQNVDDLKASEARETQLMEQALRLQRMETVGNLAAGVAHDFNNILASIRGWTELLQRGLPADAKGRGHADHVMRSVDRGHDLVQHMLSFSRNSRSDSQRTSISLAATVEQGIELVRRSVPKSVEIETSLASEQRISGDPNQIHQILLNLAANAAQAMPARKGRLRFRVEDAAHDNASSVRLTAEDDGVGMTDEVRRRAFEAFFTGGQNAERNQGTGLGLTLVEGIARQHDARVEIASAPNEGTRIAIVFPEEAAEPAPETEAIHPPEPRSIRRGSERVLFVDDEATLAELAESNLGELGYRVDAFTSALGALEAFEADPDAWDLWIVDQKMPGMTGLELIERMRARRTVPVIVQTGYSERVSDNKLREFGHAKRVMKPFETVSLTDAISELLDG